MDEATPRSLRVATAFMALMVSGVVGSVVMVILAAAVVAVADSRAGVMTTILATVVASAATWLICWHAHPVIVRLARWTVRRLSVQTIWRGH